MKNKILLILGVLLFSSCKKEEIRSDISGTWKYQYTLGNNGSPDESINTPYTDYEITFSTDNGVEINNQGNCSKYKIHSQYLSDNGLEIFRFGKDGKYYLEYYIYSSDSIRIKRLPYDVTEIFLFAPYSSAGNIFYRVE